MQVLEGEMLKSWTERVSDVKRNGWYWEYTLLGLNIDSVTVSDDGRRATAEATLQEAARWWTAIILNTMTRTEARTLQDMIFGMAGWLANLWRSCTAHVSKCLSNQGPPAMHAKYE